MLAGVTRIIEVSFIVPKYYPLHEGNVTPDDNHSEHTLADGAPSASGGVAYAKAESAFRHLPPFVSNLCCTEYHVRAHIHLQLLVASG